MTTVFVSLVGIRVSDLTAPASEQTSSIPQPISNIEIHGWICITYYCRGSIAQGTCTGTGTRTDTCMGTRTVTGTGTCTGKYFIDY